MNNSETALSSPLNYTPKKPRLYGEKKIRESAREPIPLAVYFAETISNAQHLLNLD